MTSKRRRSDSDSAREWKRLQSEARLKDMERRAEASRRNNEKDSPLSRPDDGSNPS